MNNRTFQAPANILDFKNARQLPWQELKNILVPLGNYIRHVVLEIKGCLGPGYGYNTKIDIESLGEIRKIITGNFDPQISFCTDMPSAYVACMAQFLNTFPALSPVCREKYRHNTGFKLVGFPAITGSGTTIYDVTAGKEYLNPAIKKEQLQCLDEVRKGVIPGLYQRYRLLVETFPDSKVISPYSGIGRDVEEAYFKISQELEPYCELLEVRYMGNGILISPGGISKESCMKFVLESLGMDSTGILGIGSNRDDRDWLELAGAAAAPSNGRIWLKKTPGIKYVSPYPGGGGILDIFKVVARNNLYCSYYEKRAA